MDTKRFLEVVVAALSAVALAGAQTTAPRQGPVPGLVDDSARIARMSDPERVALAKSILGHGMPPGSALGLLARANSKLILPVIEEKIEEVLRSPNPPNCFVDPTVDPQRVMILMWTTITETGDEQALIEASKLMKLDENRFGQMVDYTMGVAVGHDGAFRLAYKGFRLGDPAVDQRIVAWIKKLLEVDTYKIEDPIYDSISPARDWAVALVERYGGMPSEEQWRNDPIRLALKLELQKLLEKHMDRYFREAWEKHNLPARTLALGATEQIELAKSLLNNCMREEKLDVMNVLVRNRSSLVLPMIEDKIEEILKSDNPLDSFQDKSVDPVACVQLYAQLIAEAADEQALREARKLINLDSYRFHLIVPTVMEYAKANGNPVPLVYRGSGMGDSVITDLLIKWVAQEFGSSSSEDPRRTTVAFRLAEAMVDRYGSAPTPKQWADDPIVARLNPALVGSLHEEIIRLAHEVVERRVQK